MCSRSTSCRKRASRGSATGSRCFFAISGFLLYRPFLSARAARESLRSFTPSYLWRRFVRIIPAYWVAITVLAIWPGLEGIFSHYWWRYYLLIANYFPGVHYGLPVAWTLVIEIAFYLFLPIIALFLARRGVGSGNRFSLAWEFGVLLGLAVFSLFWGGKIVSSWIPSWNFLTLSLAGTFIWFSTGMMLAVAQEAHPSSLRWFRAFFSRPEICWPLAVAIFLLLPANVVSNAHLSFFWQLTAQNVILAVSGMLAMGPPTLNDGHPLVRVPLANKVAVFFGTISYGIYLWHYQVLTWLVLQLWAVELPKHVWLIAGMTLVVSVVLATASWYLIEKPLMRRARSVKAFTAFREGTVEIPPDEPSAAEAAAPSPAEEPAP
jgi:peptidoglycan/LPS O-acetylase OafA/YrhL